MILPIATEESEFIVNQLNQLVPANELPRGQRILMTGATGFFGKWVTQGFLALENCFGLGNRLVLVTRDRQRCAKELPWLTDCGWVEWIESDIRYLKVDGRIDMIVHGAAAANAGLNINNPNEMFDSIVDGTRQVLKLVENDCRRFLFISSGAVYGRQEVEKVPEDYRGAPDPLDAKSAYGEAKRAAELLCAAKARFCGMHFGIARCYAFCGPYLPLESHFAAGNFIANILNGDPIKISGDGTPRRSYMYPADLVVWLLTILMKGRNHTAYNVGSDHGISIRELAEAVHHVGLNLEPSRRTLKDPIQISRPPSPGQWIEHYVPEVKRAHQELGLEVWTDLNQALIKTISWHLKCRAHNSLPSYARKGNLW